MQDRKFAIFCFENSHYLETCALIFHNIKAVTKHLKQRQMLYHNINVISGVMFTYRFILMISHDLIRK